MRFTESHRPRDSAKYLAFRRIPQEAGASGYSSETVSRSCLDQLSPRRAPSGLHCRCRSAETCHVDEILAYAGRKNEAPSGLLSDAIQDVKILASLLCTAEAVGVHGVIIPDTLRRRGQLLP